MKFRIGPRARVALPAALLLMLCACGKSERDELADRIEPQIAPQHTTDPVERRQIAETLANDAVSVAEDARALEAQESARNREIEAQRGTPRQAMSAECAQSQAELAALQRPSSEIRTAEETAAIPPSIERLKSWIDQNCR